MFNGEKYIIYKATLLPLAYGSFIATLSNCLENQQCNNESALADVNNVAMSVFTPPLLHSILYLLN